MTPPLNRRDEIVDRLTDHLLARGLEVSSLRPLAAAIGTSDRMLLYYFTDKTELMGAVLERAAFRLAARLEVAIPADRLMSVDALRKEVWRALQDADLEPYMRLWLQIVGRAALNEQPFRAIGEGIAAGFLAWVEVRLAIADPKQRSAEAILILATVEGLILLKTFGVATPDA